MPKKGHKHSEDAKRRISDSVSKLSLRPGSRPLLAYDGDSKTLREWLEDPRTTPGLQAKTATVRMRRGWSVERTLTTPIPMMLDKAVKHGDEETRQVYRLAIWADVVSGSLTICAAFRSWVDDHHMSGAYRT